MQKAWNTAKRPMTRAKGNTKVVDFEGKLSGIPIGSSVEVVFSSEKYQYINQG